MGVTPRTYTVTQVNTYIKNLFTRDYALRQIAVKGEVSNCKYHTSGHIYFTLKDGTGTLAVVMFAGNRNGLRFVLQEGQQVIVLGSISVYERTGSYQLYAREIRLDGLGDFYQQLEERKARLAEMGMFAPEYKQPIPRFVRRVGIVTAPTGAAIRDIVSISQRRNPYVQLILCPAIVQGEGAAPSIVRAIRRLDAMHPDVMIVGRGGGSIEDLWAFNEEIVARAVFDCSTPVISAVGHETDTTLIDYVADLRAPTPSAAAELAVYDAGLFAQTLEDAGGRLTRLMQHALEREKVSLLTRSRRLSRLTPRAQLENRRQTLMGHERRLSEIMQAAMARNKQRLAVSAARLEAVSPLARMQSGYAFVTDGSGRPVRSVSQIHEQETVAVTVRDGSFTALVEQIDRREDLHGENI